MEKIDFTYFLEQFDLVELPITIREETFEEFSEGIAPLQSALIDQYLAIDEEDDGMTEFIACFQIPNLKEFKAIVFWKAGLLSYEYILATYRNDGQPIAAKVIAGTAVKDDQLIQSIATIDSDLIIHIATGIGSTDGVFDATQSTMRQLEITIEGEIE
jgi:hypothetical protein